VKIPHAENERQAAEQTATVATETAIVAEDEARPPRPKRRLPLLPVGIAILLALVFGGVAYVLWVATAGPPVAHTVIYHDPQHRFQFARPALWTITTASNGAHLTDSAGTSTADITLQAATPDDSATHAADTLAQQLGLTQSASKTFAGEDWQERSGQVTGSDGAVRQVVIYVSLHGGSAYTIAFSSPVASYTSTDNLVFQPLLASFSFS
jgi:hypothetical protein